MIRSLCISLLLLCLCACSFSVTTPASTQGVRQSALDESLSLPLSVKTAVQVRTGLPVKGAPALVEQLQQLLRSQTFSLAMLDYLDDYYSNPVSLTQQAGFQILYDFDFHLRDPDANDRYELIFTGRMYQADGTLLYEKTVPPVVIGSRQLDIQRLLQYLDTSVRQFIEGSLVAQGQAQLQRLAALPVQSLAGYAREVETSGQPEARFASLLGSLNLKGTGTGFYINDRGELLTARHVVSHCVAIEIVEPEGNIPATLVADERFVDLAVLRTRNASPRFAQFPAQSRPTRLGQQVAVVGYPLSTLLSNSANLTVGNVSSLSGLQGDRKYLQVSAPIQPGNSGGPVASFEGSVLGVVNSTLNSIAVARDTGTIPQNVNFAITADVAKKFLDKHGHAYHTRAAPESPNLEQTTENLQAFTRQILCKS